ncbi:receptor-type tyrosine-protein phosphatase C-like [Poeciliopsis prolifica]|uniref:receptor-type tyrosine-protein phosphatase C-like n=1 Tax=Poeciliopsis prolifica TaxID=188132 RepID=UPI0024134C47|nr:receptor-type tyrosine-protein phosphatase C-like [Poeciliopsis prolifica]
MHHTKVYGTTVREPRGGICKYDELKRYTRYIIEVYAVYNNKKVTQGSTFRGQTKPGVPDKVQQLKVHLIKHNVIRVTCSPPVGGFKGPKKVYIIRLIGDREVEETDECQFEIGDLSYLTSYTVQVVAFNGMFESEAETRNVSTHYDDKTLSGILIFILIILIIILVALRLSVFIKKRKKSKTVTKEEIQLTSTAKAYI